MTRKIKVLLLASTILLVAAGCNKTTVQNTPPQDTNQAQQQQADISYQGQDGKTALELLKGKYQVETKTYSGLGEYVTGINGLAGDTSHFWEFFVNDKTSNVGASQYVTKNSDTLEWKYSVIDSSKQ